MTTTLTSGKNTIPDLNQTGNEARSMWHHQSALNQITVTGGSKVSELNDMINEFMDASDRVKKQIRSAIDSADPGVKKLCELASDTVDMIVGGGGSAKRESCIGGSETDFEQKMKSLYKKHRKDMSEEMRREFDAHFESKRKSEDDGKNLLAILVDAIKSADLPDDARKVVIEEFCALMKKKNL